MANNFINTNWVSMKILQLLLNKLVICEMFNKNWESDFEKEFAPGSSIQVKFPQRMLVIDGMGYNPQSINRVSTTVSLDQWLQVPFEWDDYETAVKLERSKEELEENYWEPAGAALAQEWDSRAALWFRYNASNLVGALGTDPTTVQTYYQAHQILEQEACPPGERASCVTSSMMTSLGSNITNVFQPADEIKRMWKKGVIGELADSTFYSSQSIYSHTAGTWAGAVTVTGAGQSGSSIIITGTNNDTINQGDKFSIANVNAVNPMTRRAAGPLKPRTFTVTQAYTLDGSADTISFLPAIYGPGSQYQNVDALPANGAALTLWPGTTSPNGKVGSIGIMISKFAFAFVGAKLYVPTAVEDKGQATDRASGMSVRKVTAWDPVRSMRINRMDSLGGFGNFYQANGACCLLGA